MYSRISKPAMSSFEEKQRGRQMTGCSERCEKKEMEFKDQGMRRNRRYEVEERSQREKC